MFGLRAVYTSRPERTFTHIGFRDWKHATGGKGALAVHNNCLSHKESVVAWQQFKTQNNGTVSDQLGTRRGEQIKKIITIWLAFRMF